VIRHEERVELGCLKLLREALQVREIEISIGKRTGIAPCAGMDTNRADAAASLIP
jgi:hypothetical protein